MALLRLGSTYLRCFTLLAVAALSTACSGENEDGVTRYEYQDEGTLCLSTTAESPTIVTVKARYSCLSSSCDRLVSTECNVEVDGTRLVVHSTTVVDSRGGDCTADCGTVAAECQSEAMPAGTYDVVYGEQSAMVTFPLAEPRAAFDGAPFLCDGD